MAANNKNSWFVILIAIIVVLKIIYSISTPKSNKVEETKQESIVYKNESAKSSYNIHSENNANNNYSKSKIEKYHFNKIQVSEENSDYEQHIRVSRTIKVEYFEKSIFLRIYEGSKILMVLDGTLSKKDTSSFGNCDMYVINAYKDASITVCKGLSKEMSSNGIGIFIIQNGKMTEFVNE